ncbi:Methionine aminopeptidase 1 [bacterium HR17]|jgi:methionyl aminopeptidase|uniref:Methionine aminopeptidase n=1 Tax=Candidatus Fervidibacter japonicus TaxID=2035412 RepID=A0A2H5XDL3_9BACT|nr:Methionine aminopeptidase 1 [bacterium HR17]
MTQTKTRPPRARVILKTAEEIARMREAGVIAYHALRAAKEAVRPGVTPKELDAIAEAVIRQHGAQPSFKGYRGYPAATCIAVNEAVVHAIPTQRPLQEGDIVGIDLGVFYKGVHVDTGITVPVGRVSPTARKLLRVTAEALYKGIAQARAGNTVWDIAAAIQDFVEAHGFSVVRELVGHGVGRYLHEAPEIPNFTEPSLRRIVLMPGMTFAIEPMVTAGDFRVKVLPDKWTVVTVDGSLSAQFEHTVAITQDGTPLILTVGPDGEDDLWRGAFE